MSRRREFLRAQRTGRKLHTRHFLVFVLPRRGRANGDLEADARASAMAGVRTAEPTGAPTRLGITVTRKVAKAVGRNRIKRLVREAFRRERDAMPPGIDLVWVAKRDAAQATFVDVVEQMREVASRVARSGRDGRST